MYFDWKCEQDGDYHTGGYIVILSHEKNPVQCANNYYGTEVEICFSGKNQYAAALWCEENCNDQWLVGIETSGFRNEHDAMAFKLVWR